MLAHPARRETDAAAGAIGQAASPRAALAVGAAAIALVWAPILASPLRRTRELDAVPVGGETAVEISS